MYNSKKVTVNKILSLIGLLLSFVAFQNFSFTVGTKNIEITNQPTFIFSDAQLKKLNKNSPTVIQLKSQTISYIYEAFKKDSRFLSTNRYSKDKSIKQNEVVTNFFNFFSKKGLIDNKTAVNVIKSAMFNQRPTSSKTDPKYYNQKLSKALVGTLADAKVNRIKYAQAVRNMALLAYLDPSIEMRAKWKNAAYIIASLSIGNIALLEDGVDSLIPDLEGTNGGKAAIIARSFFPIFLALDLSKSQMDRFAGVNVVGGLELYSFAYRGLKLLRNEFLSGVIEWDAAKYYNQSHYNNHLTGHLLGLTATGILMGHENTLKFVYDGSAKLGGHSNPKTLKDMVKGAILTPEDYRDPTEINYRESSRNKATIINGSLYDRYRQYENKGIRYSMLQLDLLGMTSSMLSNNGYGALKYTVPSGGRENLGMAYVRMADIFNKATSASELVKNTIFNTVEYDKYIIGETRFRSYFALGRHRYCQTKTKFVLKKSQRSALCEDSGRSRLSSINWGQTQNFHELLGPVNFLLSVE